MKQKCSIRPLIPPSTRILNEPRILTYFLFRKGGYDSVIIISIFIIIAFFLMYCNQLILLRMYIIALM